jgi:hypothetical protein
MYWKLLAGLLGLVAAAGGGWALYKRGKSKGSQELDEELDSLDGEIEEMLGKAETMRERLDRLGRMANEVELGFGAINKSIEALETEIAEIANRDQGDVLPGASPA